jgi:inorganic pyrophosphatase
MSRVVEVVVESPRGSHVKWRSDGRIDFFSPIACPYNYGSVPGTLAPDGDPLDALVLGPPLPRGHSVEVAVRAEVRFVDAGSDDRKLVCKATPLTAEERAAIERFFRFYARVKRLLNLLRRRAGPTRFDGLAECD